MIFVAWFFSLLIAGCAGFFVCCILVVSQRKPRFRPIGYDQQEKYCPPIDSVSVDYRIIQGTTRTGSPYRHATVDELTDAPSRGSW